MCFVAPPSSWLKVGLLLRAPRPGGVRTAGTWVPIFRTGFFFSGEDVCLFVKPIVDMNTEQSDSWLFPGC